MVAEINQIEQVAARNPCLHLRSKRVACCPLLANTALSVKVGEPKTSGSKAVIRV